MDGNSIINTQVRARKYDIENPKAYFIAMIIGLETFDCGYQLYTLLTLSGKIIYRSQDEIVPLPPL